MLKLGRLGLNMTPEIFDRARERIAEAACTTADAMFGFAAWPLHYWRFDPLDERDFEWFEQKYPGWYDEYGFFWEAYRELSDPPRAALLLEGLLPEERRRRAGRADAGRHRGGHLPPRRRGPHALLLLARVQVAGRVATRAATSGERNWFDRYHGVALSEVVRDLGFVRSDGKTLMAQPHLGEDKRGRSTTSSGSA